MAGFAGGKTGGKTEKDMKGKKGEKPKKGVNPFAKKKK